MQYPGSVIGKRFEDRHCLHQNLLDDEIGPLCHGHHILQGQGGLEMSKVLTLWRRALAPAFNICRAQSVTVCLPMTIITVLQKCEATYSLVVFAYSHFMISFELFAFRESISQSD
jgi:hypothetical protein